MWHIPILLQSLGYHKFLQLCCRSQLRQETARISCTANPTANSQSAPLSPQDGCTEHIQGSQGTTWVSERNSYRVLYPLQLFCSQFNALTPAGTWSCALAEPADCITLPARTEITRFPLPAIPQVTAKVRREQKWYFAIQHLDSYQLINLGPTVMAKRGALQSRTRRDVCRSKRKAKLCIRQRLYLARGKPDVPFPNYFYFPILQSSFSAYLGGNRRPCHHLGLFIAVS